MGQACSACGGSHRRMGEYASARPSAADADAAEDLFKAIRDGNAGAARSILEEREPDLEARDAEGDTALLVAASMGETAICRALLEAGANADATGHDGKTALALAHALADRETVAEFTKRGHSL